MYPQPGYRILTRRIKGPAALFSSLLAWWLNSHYSHIVPVLSETECLNIVWPRPKVVPVEHFLDGSYQVKILRPVRPLTDNQVQRWLETAAVVERMEYDLESFGGFLANDGTVQDPKRVNCAEGTLMMDWSAGLMTGHDGDLISPQTYIEFARAGVFKPVFEEAR